MAVMFYPTSVDDMFLYNAGTGGDDWSLSKYKKGKFWGRIAMGQWNGNPRIIQIRLAVVNIPVV